MSEAVFGSGARLHPITHMPLENGHGALSEAMQAILHCEVIEQQQGREAADAMRAQLYAAEHPEPEIIEPEATEETEHGHEDDGRVGHDVAGGAESASDV